MKRYIKASISPSAPDWLKEALTSRFFGGIKNKLMEKYNIALDRAEFLNHETSRSIPIYLIETDYSPEVYCPGVNDDTTVFINSRNRKLGSIAKSKLPELSSDVVFIDLDDPNNFFEKKERYHDPRYTYRNDSRGRYAGQYKRRDYLGLDKETGESQYGEEYWTKSGATPSNERRARDKSGYRIPSPESKIAEYYTKYPERITAKIDSVYDRLQEVKAELMEADFNAPRVGYDDNIRDAYRTFSEAIGKYRNLLDSLDENRRFKSSRWRDDYAIQEFSKTVSIIKSYLEDVEKMLGI